MLQIRLVSAPKPPGWRHPHVVFDPEIPLDACDGLLAWGPPTPEFLSYRGPRAWYIAEPLTQGMFRTRLFRQALRIVAEHEFLHHSNSNPKYRFPCVTHYGEPTLPAAIRRTGDIVATVNNYGNRIWWIRHGVRLRTTFILHPSIDLYGSRKAWNRFRRWPWSKPGAPRNYRGPTGAPNCYLLDYVEFLARYRINVCLENAFMPYWFTEKFINAVRAGCVPIYHAHPTVRDSFLRSAWWIDPADFGFDVSATLAAAQACDAGALREHNYGWLQGDVVRSTEGYAIWSKIADHFVERIGSKVVRNAEVLRSRVNEACIEIDN
jgi:hypothetical protein